MTRLEWAKLSPEEQRIKVGGCAKFDTRNKTWAANPVEMYPDYLNDMNAMSKAVEYPTIQEYNGSRRRYIGWLSEITVGESVFATAAQQAEAFVLAVEETRDIAGEVLDNDDDVRP